MGVLKFSWKRVLLNKFPVCENHRLIFPDKIDAYFDIYVRGWQYKS